LITEQAKMEKLQKLIDKKKEPKKSVLRNFEKFLHPALLCKSSICKHAHGCFENCIRKAFKTFIYGFGTLLLLKILSMASNPAKLLKAL
jgi:hypothetical protein